MTIPQKNVVAILANLILGFIEEEKAVALENLNAKS
jgi:hypothetical protein